MRELHHDPGMFKSVLRRRLLRAAVSAVRRLDRAARGRCSFDDDHQLRACIALTRLGPTLVGDLEETPGTFAGPEWWTAEKVQMLEHLDVDHAHGDGNLEPEEWARWWLQCFRDHGPVEGKYSSNAEAMEYGRQRCRETIASLPPRPQDDDEDDQSFENRILNQGDER